jgi:hypothetical protein
LDRDHQIRLVEFDLELVALARELRDLQRVDPRGVYLGPTLLRRQCRQVGDLALASPGAQGRRIHALAAHQCAHLARLGTSVGCGQDAALVSVGEMPTPSTRHDLRVDLGRHIRRGRSGRIFSRPTGSLRCARIGQSVHFVHGYLGLMELGHTYLVAH